MKASLPVSLARLSAVLIIACAFCAPSAHALFDIVYNGNFANLSPFGQPNGWSLSGAMVGGNPGAPGGVNPNTPIIGSISQRLETQVGQYYQLSFYAAGDISQSETSALEVDWDGQDVADFTTPPETYNRGISIYSQLEWQSYSITLEANSTSTLLTFHGINNTYLYLADVAGFPVPESSTTTLMLLGVFLVAWRPAHRTRWARLTRRWSQR
jgi:hypothetical protein